MEIIKNESNKYDNNDNNISHISNNSNINPNTSDLNQIIIRLEEDSIFIHLLYNNR